jgi:Flp pilus assembly pilin Flp
MLEIVKLLSNVAHDRRGISAVEYGVLGAVVVVAIAAGASTLAGGVTGIFGSLAGLLAPATP